MLATVRLPRGPAWTAAAVTASLVAYGPLLLLVSPNADDGLVGAQAMLVAEGAVPYRDYFSPIWPGADLLFGGLFAVVGPSYLALRLLTAAALAAAVVALVAVARRALPLPWAAAVAVLWGAWMGQFLDRGPYHVLGAAALHGAAWALLRGRESRGLLAWFAIAGALAGLAVVFRQSFALAALAVVLAGFLAGGRRGLLLVSLGGVGVAAALLVWLIAAGALSHFLRQSVEFAGIGYLPANLRRMPLLPWWMTGLQSTHPWAVEPMRAGVWLGAFAAPLGAVALAAREPFRRAARLRRDVLIVAVIAVGMFASALYRATAAVLWPSAGLALVLGAAWMRGALPRRGGAAALALAVTIGLFPGAAYWMKQAGIGPGAPFRFTDHTVGPALAAARWAPEVERLARFAEQRPGETGAFLPALKAMYLLTGRPPPISFVILRRGYNTEDHVRLAQRELVARRVEWVLYLPAARDLFRRRPEPWRFERFLEARYEHRGILAELHVGDVEVYALRGA